MSASMTMLRSQTQASDIFSQTGGYPKQKHVFLVRFFVNGGSMAPTSTLTFAVKSIDRPVIQPHIEELSQYNRKRQVYTGYKMAPLKVQFYDTADQAALIMWANYSKYYFGDFGQNSPSMFSGADIYGPYEIIHPKIVAFNPDDLDYEQSGVATIGAEFAFEAMLMTVNAGVASATPEMQPGALYYGNPITSQTNDPSIPSVSISTIFPTNTANVLVNLFGGSSRINTPLSDYRYYGTASGGGLGVFGNFAFGLPSIGSTRFGVNISASLASAAISNPALASALNLNYAANSPLTTGYSPAVPGIPAAIYNPMAAEVGAAIAGGNATSGFGQSLKQAMIGAAVLGGVNGLNQGLRQSMSGGLVLTPAAYSMMNAQRPGMAQVGYNSNIGSDGQNYGFNGINGYAGPSGSPAPPTQAAEPFDRAVTPEALPLPLPTSPPVNDGTAPVSATMVPPAAAPGSFATGLNGSGSTDASQQVATTDGQTGISSPGDYTV